MKYYRPFQFRGEIFRDHGDLRVGGRNEEYLRGFFDRVRGSSDPCLPDHPLRDHFWGRAASGKQVLDNKSFTRKRNGQRAAQTPDAYYRDPVHLNKIA
jgi:hypothetical protein